MNTDSRNELRNNMAFSPYIVDFDNQKDFTAYTKFINTPPSTNEYLKILETNNSTPMVDLDSIDDIYEEESLIIKDLMNVLMGQEGTFICYSSKNSGHEEQNTNKTTTTYTYTGSNDDLASRKKHDPRELLSVKLPDYIINKKMNSSIKQMCKKSFIKLGKCINFINRFNQIVLENEEKFGIYLTYLVKYEIIENFLMNDYYKFLIFTLGLDHYKYDTNGYSLRTLEYEMSKRGYMEKVLKIYKIYSGYIGLYKERLSMDRIEAEFDMLLNKNGRNESGNIHSINNNDNNNSAHIGKDSGSSRNSLWINEDVRISEIPKGGNVIKLVYKTGFENVVLQKYIDDLNLWCVFGELQDDFEEFLISDLTKTETSNSQNIMNNERLWDIKYNIRKDGLLMEEIFGNDEDILYKILMTGKFLNVYSLIVPFGKSSTQSLGPITIADIQNINLLRVKVNELYLQANLKIYELFDKGYNFNNLLKDIQKFYLLQETGKINEFFNISLIELTRSPSKLILNKLQNCFKKITQDCNIMNKRELSKGYKVDDFISLNFDNLNLLDLVKQFKLLSSSSLSSSNTAFTVGNENSKNSKNLNQMILQDLQKEQDYLQKHSYNAYDNITNTVAEVVDTDDLEQKNIDEGVHDDVHDDDDYNNRNDKNSRKKLKRSKSKKSKKNKSVSIYYLNFECNIPFPLNIIINKTIIIQYQMIQRKLLIVKYMEKLLNDLYVEINKNSYWKYLSLIDIENNGVENETSKILKQFKMLHYRMRLFIKHLQEHCYNNILMLEFESNDTFMDTYKTTTTATRNPSNIDFMKICNDLNNRLTDCVLKLWLTNDDLIYLEMKIFETIFKYCKYLTTIRNKLPLINYKLYQYHHGITTNTTTPTSTTNTSTNLPMGTGLNEEYNENNIDSIINDDFKLNYKKNSKDFNYLIKLYIDTITKNSSSSTTTTTSSSFSSSISTTKTSANNNGKNDSNYVNNISTNHFLQSIINLT